MHPVTHLQSENEKEFEVNKGRTADKKVSEISLRPAAKRPYNNV